MSECRKCGDEFVLTPDKPGLIHHCPECSKEKVEKVGGNMVWSHKTAPEIEIKPMDEAKAFAKKTKRFGPGVTKCLTTSQYAAAAALIGEKPAGFERE